MDENTKELSKKLGINVNNVLYTLHAPDNYLQALAVPTSIEEIKDMDGSIDWIQTFNKDIQATRDETTVIKSKLVQSGQLWICWPKKSSRVSTNLTDKTVWQIGLDNGLVDTKVVAVNDTWSGLKFVYRLSDRKF